MTDGTDEGPPLVSTLADAEDICHDGLVRALARVQDCRQPERFAQWLCAIVRHHARNELTRNTWSRYPTPTPP
jgi:DNA-directed RNA polymerase specialized sigma24 family protein